MGLRGISITQACDSVGVPFAPQAGLGRAFGPEARLGFGSLELAVGFGFADAAFFGDAFKGVFLG